MLGFLSDVLHLSYFCIMPCLESLLKLSTSTFIAYKLDHFLLQNIFPYNL